MYYKQILFFPLREFQLQSSFFGELCLVAVTLYDIDLLADGVCVCSCVSKHTKSQVYFVDLTIASLHNSAQSSFKCQILCIHAELNIYISMNIEFRIYGVVRAQSIWFIYIYIYKRDVWLWWSLINPHIKPTNTQHTIETPFKWFCPNNIGRLLNDFCHHHKWDSYSENVMIRDMPVLCGGD